MPDSHGDPRNAMNGGQTHSGTKRAYRDRRIDFPAICFGTPLHVAVGEIHI
jgi:hypothetical protein